MKKKEIKWKVAHASGFDQEYNFLDTVIEANGVPKEDVKYFLRPTSKFIQDPFTMKNMDKAVDLFRKHIKNSGNIFIKGDPDVDGACSLSMMYQFIKALNPEINVDFQINTDKQHGLTYRDVSSFTANQYDLFIIPDASLECADAARITRNFKADILVLDHHLVLDEYLDKENGAWISPAKADELRKFNEERVKQDVYTNYCVAVNCTDGQYVNSELCGAGVVQKFIEAYIEKYGAEDSIDPKYSTYFYDLVSLANIADSIDLRSLETRYYVLEGLKERRYVNDFINELVLKQVDEMPFGRYINSMAWKIAPLINGVVRFGEYEEQLMMYRAICNIQETIEYQPRRKRATDPKPPVELQTLQKAAARMVFTVKNRQDTQLRPCFKTIVSRIENDKLYENSVIFVDGTDILTKKTLSGLVAGKLTSEYLRPAVLLKEFGSTEYGGSFRGYERGPIPDANKFLTECGVQCAGHPNAGGVKFKKADLPEIIKKCNEKIPPDEMGTIYPCDWEIPGDKLKEDYVRDVAENYSVFCKTVPEPLFAITGIKVNASEIHVYGDNSNFIKFNYNGINYTKKYCKRSDYPNLTQEDPFGFGVNKKDLDITIIGQFILAPYEGKMYPQVNIVDFQSKVVGDKTKPIIKAADVESKKNTKKEEEDDFFW